MIWSSGAGKRGSRRRYGRAGRRVAAALDRIVVDECHTVLDSDREMRAMGQTLREIGVQMVFLTATLAPDGVAD